MSNTLHCTNYLYENFKLTAIPSAVANFSAEAFRSAIPTCKCNVMHNTALLETQNIINVESQQQFVTAQN